MKNITRHCFLFFGAFVFSFGLYAQAAFWIPVAQNDLQDKPLAYRNSMPRSFSLFKLNTAAFRSALANAPQRFTSNSEVDVNLPTADGKLQAFRVYEASVFSPALQAEYPNIRSYAAQGIDDPTAIARFSVSKLGAHFMISSGNHSTVYIDPYTKDKSVYIVYTVDELPPPNLGFQCHVGESMRLQPDFSQNTSLNMGDGELLTYRLALACTAEYAQYHLNNQGIPASATSAEKKAAVLSEMAIALTRIDGIYERDLGVTMQLVDDEDEIIFLNAATDPYTNENLGEMLSENQTTCDAQIGTANYDIGHVFGTSGGGLAYSPCVCSPNYKAGGGTGLDNPIGDYFYVSYVSHEMGHQFGASHSFSGDTGGCAGNRTDATAMEPGSGSTIMSYAGLCTGENVTGDSDAYFHAVSIAQILDNIYNGSGQCGVATSTGDNAPTADAGADYTIPKSTAFILTGTATDPDGNASLTYSWEEMDPVVSGTTFTQPPVSTNTSGPMFRSLQALSTPVRYFPNLFTVLGGNLQSTWEVVPAIGRSLHFRFIVRDNFAGGAQTASDDMVLTIDGSSGPFVVTSQNAASTWDTQTTETITWNVAGTNSAPVNCENVDILFSTDGGYTYPITLASGTPNDGSTVVPVPGLNTNFGRIMIKGSGNVFYDINNAYITVQGDYGVDSFTLKNFKVYPNPSKGVVNLEFVSVPGKVRVSLYDITGKRVDQKEFDGSAAGSFKTRLDYSALAPGLYFLKVKNGNKAEVVRLVRK